LFEGHNVLQLLKEAGLLLDTQEVVKDGSHLHPEIMRDGIVEVVGESHEHLGVLGIRVRKVLLNFPEDLVGPADLGQSQLADRHLVHV